MVAHHGRYCVRSRSPLGQVRGGSSRFDSGSPVGSRRSLGSCPRQVRISQVHSETSCRNPQAHDKGGAHEKQYRVQCSTRDHLDARSCSGVWLGAPVLAQWTQTSRTVGLCQLKGQSVAPHDGHRRSACGLTHPSPVRVSICRYLRSLNHHASVTRLIPIEGIGGVRILRLPVGSGRCSW